MKKRLLSLVLCLVMVFALFPTFAAPAMAADANGITNPPKAQDESGNLNLTKTLAPGADGTYDITMESWATGEVKTQGIVEKIPTDFVLVVDQSGSMDTSDMPTGTPSVQNNKYLEDIANGAYYYKDGDNYYRVYGVKDYLFRYYPANTWFTGDIVDHLGTDIGWFMGETDATTNIDNAFYFREVVNGTTYYIPIRTTIRGRIGTYDMRFSYPSKRTGSTYEFDREVTTYSSNGNSPWYHNVLNGQVMSSGAMYEAANIAVQALYRDDHMYTYSEVDMPWPFSDIRTGMYVNYPMYGRHLSYTKLCYRDVNGVEHTLPSNQSGQTVWEYCDDDGYARTTNSVTSNRPTYSGLYTFPTQTDRITALKAALNEFAQAVANEEDDFGAVDNRVSIVGFSSTSSSAVHDPSGSPNYSNYNYNTELLTHTERDITGTSTNGWQKSTCDGNVSEYYGKGLVGATNGSVGTVNSKISRAITAITANGGTQPEDGLNMAYKVLTNRGNTTYTIRSGEHKDETVDRNTVVIFFTDGQPGNLHMSDQYSEANEVVAQAKYIKDYGASLYSIGVFGESDANPLTYADTSQSQSNRQAWKYLGGWMETHQSNGTYFCLRRQWRPNNAEGYTATPNDTIYDYMSVVSSNYPDAKNYIAPAWMTGGFSGNYIAATDGDTVRQKSTAEATNKYYRMASNENTLIKAFLAAVTMNNEETTTDTSVPLDATAIFKDKVNLADFDITGATYTVQWQPVKEQSGQIVNNGSAVTKVNGAAVPADGQINYSGFNYSENFVTSAHNGQKLVVTINGLTPKKASGTLYSNDGKAGVYGPEDEEATVEIVSPTLEFPASAAKTIVIDYNYPVQLTTAMVSRANASINGVKGAIASVNTFEAYSGTYTVEGASTLNYQLFTGDVNPEVTGSGTATGAVDLGKYQGVDKAMFYTGSGWQSVTTLPATTVYYSDALTAPQTDLNGDGSNGSAVSNAETYDTAKYGKQISYTFTGTGIDVYSKTTPGSNYIIGMLSGVTDPSYKANATYKNASNEDRVNVPSIFFHDLPYGTYTLKLYASKGANFLFDGIRVYNPAGTADEASQAIYAAEDLKEQKAHFTNMRALLSAGANMGEGIGFFSDTDVTGENEKTVTIVINNPDGTEKSREEYTYRAHSLTAYNLEGPKDEIYLEPGNAIAFTITNMPAESLKFMMGIHISAVRSGSGSLTIGGKAVTSVDQYFDVTPGNDNTIRVANPAGSGVLLSVTNLKISGGSREYTVQANGAMPLAVVEDDAAADVGVLNIAVTEETVEVASKLNALRYAADNNGVIVEDDGEIIDPGQPDTPDEPDTPATPSLIDLIRQMISNFVSNLFKNVARLFGN